MSCHRCNLPARNQSGAALVVALLIFALAAALMVGIQRDFTLTMQRGTNYFTEQQGWAYLRGAEALATVALRADGVLDKQLPAPRDDLTEIWAAEATPYPLEGGGWLSGQLEDLQGRFNLNLLVSDLQDYDNDGDTGKSPDPDTEGADLDLDDAQGEDAIRSAQTGQGDREQDRLSPAKQIFIRLLQALDGVEVSQQKALEIADAVADFIDTDNQKRLNGAEDDVYRSATPPYRAANQPMASISELRAVSGITREIYTALAPLVTVWPAEGAKLNVLTAPAKVLRSLNGDGQLEPLSEEVGLQLVEAREQGQIADVESFLATAAFSGDTTGLNGLLAESTDWFLLSAIVEIADRELQLYSVLQRDGDSIVGRYRSRGEL